MSFAFEFSILPKVNQAIIEIERVRGFLDAIKSEENWLLEMQNEVLILESHYSTHIEGTALTLDESRDILEGIPVKGANSEDKQELLNYRKALDFVSEHLNKNTPITEQLIKGLHRITVKDVRSNQADPGNYRKVQNHVVDLNTQKIIYTPPPPSEVPRLMKEFVAWLNKKKEFLSPIFIAGIAQIQLVNIHPFVDGNGRTARLLASLILYTKGYDFKRLFSISEYYDKNRPSYYEAIRSVSQNDMDLTWWLEYFVKGLQLQISKIREKAEDIIQLELLIKQLNLCELNDCQEKIIGYIFFKGNIDSEKCQKLCRLTKTTSTRNLTSLAKKDLIEKEDDKNIPCYIFSNLVLGMIKNIKKNR
jgi:Fic family protein